MLEGQATSTCCEFVVDFLHNSRLLNLEVAQPRCSTNLATNPSSRVCHICKFLSCERKQLSTLKRRLVLHLVIFYRFVFSCFFVGYFLKMYLLAILSRDPRLERCIYKSLLTENTVATQKHNSASINTNKIQYKIQRSSPSQ